MNSNSVTKNLQKGNEHISPSTNHSPDSNSPNLNNPRPNTTNPNTQKKINLKVIKDIQECQQLWNKYSPHRTLWDEWEIALVFYDPLISEPHFILVEDENNIPLGLFPFIFKKETGLYRMFGGDYGEDYLFWLDPIHLNMIIHHIPGEIKIFDINGDAAKQAIKNDPKLSTFLTFDDYHYFIDLEKFHHKLEEYLQTFTKKHRKNFLYDLRKIQETPYTFHWEGIEHYDDFVKFSVARFQEESDFIDEHYVRCFKKLLTLLHKKQKLLTLTVSLDGILQGLEFAVFDKGIYYVLNGGYNPQHQNLGKLIIFKHLENAIKLKAQRIDFLSGDTGWKKLWNSQTEEYYSLRKIS